MAKKSNNNNNANSTTSASKQQQQKPVARSRGSEDEEEDVNNNNEGNNSNGIKYPKTPHLPFSPCINDDDIQLPESFCSQFLNREVIITEKADGGCCQLYRGKVFARTNAKEATHPSFSGVKALYSQFSFMVPDSISLYGENMFGVHSIEYNKLKSYLYLFAALRDQSQWLSFDEVKVLADSYGVPTVPVLFRGTFRSLHEIKQWMDNKMKEASVLVRHYPLSLLSSLLMSLLFL
eukprot:GEZU01021532.1.p1 GENE.GEZU01021532.1~~GEZU01021532.1.p1  ORF type:complete len:235 (-),score=57.35 GEZU01021532.1:36-740(-)